uniref:Uncharacterized protein n=1 Tax=Eiseniibacteriota bacterium TaxID=2212470 RepID=A0A832MKW2_UNCEI
MAGDAPGAGRGAGDPQGGGRPGPRPRAVGGPGGAGGGRFDGVARAGAFRARGAGGATWMSVGSTGAGG